MSVDPGLPVQAGHAGAGALGRSAAGRRAMAIAGIAPTGADFGASLASAQSSALVIPAKADRDTAPVGAGPQGVDAPDARVADLMMLLPLCAAPLVPVPNGAADTAPSQPAIPCAGATGVAVFEAPAFDRMPVLPALAGPGETAQDGAPGLAGASRTALAEPSAVQMLAGSRSAPMQPRFEPFVADAPAPAAAVPVRTAFGWPAIVPFAEPDLQVGLPGRAAQGMVTTPGAELTSANQPLSGPQWKLAPVVDQAAVAGRSGHVATVDAFATPQPSYVNGTTGPRVSPGAPVPRSRQSESPGVPWSAPAQADAVPVAPGVQALDPMPAQLKPGTVAASSEYLSREARSALAAAQEPEVQAAQTASPVLPDSPAPASLSQARERREAVGPDSGHASGLFPVQPGTGSGQAPWNAPETSLPLEPPSVAEQVSYLVSHGIAHAEISLDGAGAGPVEVRIELQGNQANVEFRTDNSEVRQLLESTRAELKDALERQGLMLGGVSVHTSGSGGQNDRGPAARLPEPTATRLAPTDEAAPPRAASSSRGAVDLYV